MAPSHNLPKILPEVEEVVAHHDDNKIEELLKERDPQAFIKHFKQVLERFEIPHDCKDQPPYNYIYV